VRASWRTATLAVVGGVFIAACPAAGAQPQLPTLRVESTTDAGLFQRSCGVPAPTILLGTPGRVVVSRTSTTTATLSFAYQVDGPAERTSGSAQFAPGSRTVAIAIVPLTSGSFGHIQLRLLPGADYDLGSPVVGTVFVGVVADGCARANTTTTVAAPERGPDLPRSGTDDATFALVGVTLVLAGGALLSMRRGRRAHRRA
jgi:LPXTG-motif cell wall-anchored protein